MAEVSEIEAGGEVRTVKDTTARKSLIYSTDELDTKKTWINGKPIYRKVFTGLSITITASSWYATDIDSPDIDCIVHSQLIGIDSNAIYQENEFPCAGTVAINKDTQKLNIITVGYRVIVKKIILEYTKTTD